MLCGLKQTSLRSMTDRHRQFSGKEKIEMDLRLCRRPGCVLLVLFVAARQFPARSSADDPSPQAAKRAPDGTELPADAAVLSRHVDQLIAQGRYAQAIPLAAKARWRSGNGSALRRSTRNV